MEPKNRKELSFLILPLAALTGICSGLLGAMFAKSVSFVTQLREENSWLLYLIILGGILTVGIYKLLKVEGVGTNRIFDGFKNGSDIPFHIIPAIFLSTVITHLFGGSAGREGAALQLGGGISAIISKIFKVNNSMRRVLVLCGMASFFSAIFGTPFGAAIFALEVVLVGKAAIFCIIPTLISSILGFIVASSLKVAPERFPFTYNFNISDIWKVILISAICSFIAFIFCKSLHISERFAQKYIKNPFLRISIGAALIIILTLIVGSFDYNGSGIHYIAEIFKSGSIKPEAFILKLIFTVITVSAGFKGGEIIPSFFIGAALGGTLAALSGLPIPLGAAVGMTALFCWVTKCPIASFVLAFELFGFSPALIFIGLAVIIAYFLSGKTSLYQ